MNEDEIVFDGKCRKDSGKSVWNYAMMKQLPEFRKGCRVMPFIHISHLKKFVLFKVKYLLLIPFKQVANIFSNLFQY